VKINIFQRFKYYKNCTVSTTLLVFEMLTNIELQDGKSHFFKNEITCFGGDSPRSGEEVSMLALLCYCSDIVSHYDVIIVMMTSLSIFIISLVILP